MRRGLPKTKDKLIRHLAWLELGKLLDGQCSPHIAKAIDEIRAYLFVDCPSHTVFLDSLSDPRVVAVDIAARWEDQIEHIKKKIKPRGRSDPVTKSTLIQDVRKAIDSGPESNAALRERQAWSYLFDKAVGSEDDNSCKIPRSIRLGA